MKNSVYVFDVDGVLTDLRVGEPDPRIIMHIAALLDAGTIVAINTGRGYDWLEENVVQPLRIAVKNTDSLDHFFVAVEMGGIGVRFDGRTENRIKSTFSLTEEQMALVRSTFESHAELMDKLYWYGKESMATLVKSDTISMDVFRPIQRALTVELQEVFKDQEVTVANSNDAIDVHAVKAGKWAGAALIYSWLNESTDMKSDHFVCFGDSAVDYEMARFFAEQSHDTVFVFTGSELEDKNTSSNLSIIKTTQPYNEGAYQYLQSILPQHPNQ